MSESPFSHGSKGGEDSTENLDIRGALGAVK